MDDAKTREILYRQIEGLYSWLTDKLPARQDNLLKTYLWSASLALSLSLAALDKLARPALGTPFAGAAAFMAFAVLIYTLDTLRGRAKQDTQTPDFFWYLDQLQGGSPAKETFAMLTEQMKETISHQIATKSSIAKKLRDMSKGLVASFVFLFLAGVAHLLR